MSSIRITHEELASRRMVDLKIDTGTTRVWVNTSGKVTAKKLICGEWLDVIGVVTLDGVFTGYFVTTDGQ
jgi:methionine salvage enolase-phosphatase E1